MKTERGPRVLLVAVFWQRIGEVPLGGGESVSLRGEKR